MAGFHYAGWDDDGVVDEFSCLAGPRRGKSAMLAMAVPDAPDGLIDGVSFEDPVLDGLLAAAGVQAAEVRAEGADLRGEVG